MLTNIQKCTHTCCDVNNKVRVLSCSRSNVEPIPDPVPVWFLPTKIRTDIFSMPNWITTQHWFIVYSSVGRVFDS